MMAKPEHGVDVGAVVHLAGEDERWSASDVAIAYIGIGVQVDAVGDHRHIEAGHERWSASASAWLTATTASAVVQICGLVPYQLLPLDEAIGGATQRLWLLQICQRIALLQQVFAVVVVEDPDRAPDSDCPLSDGSAPYCAISMPSVCTTS